MVLVVFLTSQTKNIIDSFTLDRIGNVETSFRFDQGCQIFEREKREIDFKKNTSSGTIDNDKHDARLFYSHIVQGVWY